MKNGFYHLQDEYAGSIPAFLDALDDIEANIPVQFKSGESITAPVSVASFMLGFCGELAMYFHRKYGYEIGLLQDEDELLHVFNVISPSPSKRYFLDARGITDEISLFLEPFCIYPGNILYAKDIETAQDLAPDGEWHFPEDEISDAMIGWLLDTYPAYYDPSPLFKSQAMRYRYITNGRCKPTDPICDFRLISHREIGKKTRIAGETLYRVCIPDDLHLEKYSCDSYSTTNDKRTIEELGYDIVMTMWDGKRKVLPKDADVEAISTEQFGKWRKSLAEKPETAHQMPHLTPEDLDNHLSNKKNALEEIISSAKAKTSTDKQEPPNKQCLSKHI